MKASRLLIAGTAALLPIAGAFAQNTEPAQPDPATQPAQQGATFESLDKNSDGRISKTEAAADANVNAQFSSYDLNGNGFIERDEVTSANKANPNSPKKQ